MGSHHAALMSADVPVSLFGVSLATVVESGLRQVLRDPLVGDPSSNVCPISLANVGRCESNTCVCSGL